MCVYLDVVCENGVYWLYLFGLKTSVLLNLKQLDLNLTIPHRKKSEHTSHLTYNNLLSSNSWAKLYS